MQERKSNRVVWIVLGAALGLLFVVGISAIAGGVAGYLAGRAAVDAHAGPTEAPFEFRFEPRGQAPDVEPLVPSRPRDGMPDLDRFGDLALGALITAVAEDSAAGRAGLQVGDLIIAIDGSPFENEEDLVDLITDFEPGDTITIALAGPGREPDRMVKVTLGRHPERGGETAYLGITYRMVPADGFGDRTPFRNR